MFDVDGVSSIYEEPEESNEPNLSASVSDLFEDTKESNNKRIPLEVYQLRRYLWVYLDKNN